MGFRVPWVLGVGVLAASAGFLYRSLPTSSHPSSPDVQKAIDREDQAPPPRRFFRDVTAESGVHIVTMCGPEQLMTPLDATGTGAALFDYDGDGDLDLYVVNGGEIDVDEVRDLVRGVFPLPDALYRNRGDGTFEDVSAQAGISDERFGQGVAVGDFDNDGDPDIYVTNYDANILYRNNGDGTFSDISRSAGVDCPLWSAPASWFDYDKDGDLDLFVGNFCDLNIWQPILHAPDGRPCMATGSRSPCGPGLYGPLPSVLYRNDGNERFTDVSNPAGLRSTYGRCFGIVAFDYNCDGWDDLYCANDAGENYLFKNLGDGAFLEVSKEVGGRGMSDGRWNGSMGVAVADPNGDEFPDIFVTNALQEQNCFYFNNGGALLQEITDAVGLGHGLSFNDVGWGTRFLDIDRDGAIDLIWLNGNFAPAIDASGQAQYAQPGRIALGNGDGTFRPVPAPDDPFSSPRHGRGLAVGDVDGDGLLDLVIVNRNRPVTILRGEGGGHVVAFRLEGASPSNRDAYGARIALRAGGKRQVQWVRTDGSFLSSSEPAVYFGLGDRTRCDSVDIRWPSGREETLPGLDSGREYRVTEGKGVVWSRPFHP